MPLLLKRLPIFIILLLIIFAALLAASQGVAALSALKARYTLEQWQNSNREFNIDDWQAAVENMSHAIGLSNNNPQYEFDLARLYEWRAVQTPIWTKSAKQYRSKAIQHYRRAVNFQPVWARAWINLAITKTLNQQFGSDVITAIEQAIRYGSWEGGVHRKIIWLSLSTWPQLPASTQQKIRSLISSSLKEKRDVKFINNTSNRFKWQAELSMIKNNANIR